MEEIYKMLQNNNFKYTTDTRNQEPGKAFFALVGENFDGNDYVLDALENGAPFVVCNKKELAEKDDRVFYVKSTMDLLLKIARHHRDQFDIPVIAITGSNGKTTTKEFVRDVLEKKYSVLSTRGNLNNYFGVPFTLLGLREDHDIAIIELGANHVGEIADLCAAANPTHGLITNIGEAHMGKFGGPEGVRKAKGELYDFLSENGGTVYVDLYEENLVHMAAERDLEGIPYVENIDVDLKLFGSYNMQNARAAYTVGEDFGVSEKDIIDAIENYEPKSSRSRIRETEMGNTIIADMYNANPTSMSLALKEFAETENQKEKIVVIGDMLELEEYSQEKHQGIVDLLHELKLENVCLVGEEFQKVAGQFKSFEKVEDCIEFLKPQEMKNKFVFMKGSRGIKLERILNQKAL